MNFNIVENVGGKRTVIFMYRWFDHRLEVWSEQISRFIVGDLRKARSRAEQFNCLGKFEIWYDKVKNT